MDNTLKIVPVILAGGTGTRLWPLSRESYPKQLLTFTGGYSLLQQTILRIANYPDLTNFMVICNEQHATLIQTQIDELKLQLDYQLILEPIGRNTAPAVAVAANYILQCDPTASMLILAADHHMEDEKRFMELITHFAKYAQQNYLITFGVHPAKPETGYGYIQTGEKLESDIYRIAKFVEKPDYKTAQKYVESKDYYWNSGIFLFSAQAFLDELKRHRNDIYNAVKLATTTFVDDGNFLRFNKELFSNCPSESIDYAVMEKSTCGLMIKLDVVWSDLGSWSSIYEIMSKDEQQNSIVGDVILDDCYGCYVHAQSRLVAAVGLSDQVIIETEDAVLVMPRARAQQVKDILEQLKKKKGAVSNTHKRVYRPWGFYDTLSEREGYIIRELHIRPRASLSSHAHESRTEHWIVLSGCATVIKNSERHVLNPQESCQIEPNTIHQLCNFSIQALRVLEIQSGSHFSIDDVKYHVSHEE